LIVSAGVQQSYFGHDELAAFAPGMKTLDDARELRRRIFGAFEMAEIALTEEERRHWLTFAVVGAGPTGVELAGQVRELAVRSLTGEYRTFDPASVRVVLVDGGKEPLATFGNKLSNAAARELTKLGVELRMGQRVVGIDRNGLDLVDGQGVAGRLEAGVAIWAAGVQATPLAGMLAEASGAELDRSGRIKVLPDLTLPGHPEVFALGDMTSLNNLPGVAEVAMQGGLHAANTITRRLKGEDARPFKYRDVGSVATIGRFRAVAEMRRIRLSGLPGWLVWFFVHLAFLNGFGGRFSTMLRWLRSMVGRGRPEREISSAHTGGDLSLPESVRRIVQPNLYPEADEVGADHDQRS
jgi:NADH dehydrogenase